LYLIRPLCRVVRKRLHWERRKKEIEYPYIISSYKNINGSTRSLGMLFQKLFHFVLCTTRQLHIDESHAVGHSMQVLHHAHNILESELCRHPQLDTQRKIIYTAAIVHDMCDSKYMDKSKGLSDISTFLASEQLLKKSDIDIVSFIISSMSYSKVKLDGYPNFFINPHIKQYEMAYHIVREADLLSAYDFDRSVLFNFNRNNDFSKSVENGTNLFQERMFKHNKDGLFITDYSKKKSKLLEQNAIQRINQWNSVLKYDF
jgi:HD superfamily phosphodiesterase